MCSILGVFDLRPGADLAALNAQPGGAVGVGHDDAGVGSVEQMSGAQTIERINASGADFVVAALGAKKGQAWILHNQQRLQALAAGGRVIAAIP